MSIAASVYDQPVQIPTSAATLEGFRAWAQSDEFPQRGRISFINQEIVIDMSPEELEKHNKVKKEISRVLETLIRDLDLGTLYPDGAAVTHEGVELSTEPDATFVSWNALETGRVRLLPRAGHPDEFVELEGSPDWVLEVVSRSSLKKDSELLRTQYHAAGIREYWLVNALDEEIDFQILLHASDGYVAATRQDGWHPSTVFGHSFRLTRSPDRLGYWRYTLDVREG